MSEASSGLGLLLMPTVATIATVAGLRIPVRQDANPNLRKQQRQHVANAACVIGLTGWADMPQRCKLCSDSPEAAALTGLGRLASEPTRFGDSCLWDRLTTLTASRFTLFPTLNEVIGALVMIGRC